MKNSAQSQSELPRSEVVSLPESRLPGVRDTLVLLRPAHWIKNSLVFVPLLASHRFTEPATLARTTAGFVVFCLLASLIYVINDLIDCVHDRKDTAKAKRPIAAGRIGKAAALGIAGVLLLGIAVSCILARIQPTWLIAYLLVNLGYSLAFKAWPIYDLVCLSFFYLARVHFGADVGGIEVSHWLSAFSLFLFFSLSSLKRVSELHRPKAVSGRGYTGKDSGMLRTLGVSGYNTACLVLVLYVQFAENGHLYRRMDYLYLLPVILFVWSSLLWLASERGEIKSDPIVFALKYPSTYFLFGAAGVVWFLAI